MRKLLPPLIALCLLSLAACSCQEKPHGVTMSAVEQAEAGPHFIEDDYPLALARARERNLPLFVDTWAPWCHSCLSMKRTVLRDPRLAPMADRFVWLSLNTEKEESAAFLERHPQNVWPTLTILEPQGEGALLRWLGSLTVDELLGLLGDGLRAAAADVEGQDALLAEADRLYARGEVEEASRKLKEALAQAPKGWKGRPRAVIGLLATQRYGLGAMEECTQVALQELPSLERTASWAKVAALGLRCAADLAPTPVRNEAIGKLEAAVREALAPPLIEMSGDDRSNLYELLTNVRRKLGDQEGARGVAREWLAFLEQEAAKSADPEIRAIFDSHRLLASLLLQTPERVIAALQESERAAPDDYNAPARLALVYQRLGRLDEALQASDRALATVYGPRKMRVLNDRGDILLERGEREEAHAAYSAALTWADRLPVGQRPSREIDRAKSGLAPLGDGG